MSNIVHIACIGLTCSRFNNIFSFYMNGCITIGVPLWRTLPRIKRDPGQVTEKWDQKPVICAIHWASTPKLEHYLVPPHLSLSSALTRIKDIIWSFFINKTQNIFLWNSSQTEITCSIDATIGADEASCLGAWWCNYTALARWEADHDKHPSGQKELHSSTFLSCYGQSDQPNSPLI